jgi:hypothetical protein
LGGDLDSMFEGYRGSILLVFRSDMEKNWRRKDCVGYRECAGKFLGMNSEFQYLDGRIY